MEYLSGRKRGRGGEAGGAGEVETFRNVKKWSVLLYASEGAEKQ